MLTIPGSGRFLWAENGGGGAEEVWEITHSHADKTCDVQSRKYLLSVPLAGKSLPTPAVESKHLNFEKLCLQDFKLEAINENADFCTTNDVTMFF